LQVTFFPQSKKPLFTSTAETQNPRYTCTFTHLPHYQKWCCT